MIISEDSSNKEEIERLSSLSFTIIEDLPIAEINIQGEPYAFILDSGASTHFIDENLIHKFNSIVKATGIEKSIITAGGADKISREYNIPNCKIGQLHSQLTAFEKDFSLLSETLGKDISGLLSLSKLSHNKVYIDLKSKNIYFN